MQSGIEESLARMKGDSDCFATAQTSLGDAIGPNNVDNKALEKLKEKYDVLVANTVKLLADNELLHSELNTVVRDNSRLQTGNKLTGKQLITGREKLNTIDVVVEKGSYSFIMVALVAIICYYFGKFSNS